MSKKKILIIEDDDSQAQALTAFLEMKNYQVLQAYSGETGLELIQTDLPDLILLDIFLPGEDGLSILKRLKRKADPDTGEASKTSHIPVIVLTGKGDMMEEVFEMEEAFAFFRKPYEHQALLTSIQRALESKK